MRDSLRDSATVRAAKEFIIICHNLRGAANAVRPASIWRLEQASHQIMHFAIHADTHMRRKGRRWRLEHAIRAGYCARRCLKRVAKVETHRVMCSACADVLDRLMMELQNELEANEKDA